MDYVSLPWAMSSAVCGLLGLLIGRHYDIKGIGGIIIGLIANVMVGAGTDVGLWLGLTSHLGLARMGNWVAMVLFLAAAIIVAGVILLTPREKVKGVMVVTCAALAPALMIHLGLSHMHTAQQLHDYASSAAEQLPVEISKPALSARSVSEGGAAASKGGTAQSKRGSVAAGGKSQAGGSAQRRATGPTPTASAATNLSKVTGSASKPDPAKPETVRMQVLQDSPLFLKSGDGYVNSFRTARRGMSVQLVAPEEESEFVEVLLPMPTGEYLPNASPRGFLRRTILANGRGAKADF